MLLQHRRGFEVFPVIRRIDFEKEPLGRYSFEQIKKTGRIRLALLVLMKEDVMWSLMSKLKENVW